jgi:glyoxylase-like metal-dependent hydrolase (beta-lactamase superfamily II)
MLKATQIGDVTEIKMGRSLDGVSVLYWVAAYLIGGILIDTGCDYSKKELGSLLEGKEISVIVNTHYHEDHVGGNAFLTERFGIVALAHPVTISLMSKKYDLYEYEREIWGYPDSCTANLIGDLVEGDAVSLSVIETQGHCKGHISLFEKDRGILFSGDTWVGERPKAARAEENLTRLISDLMEFEALRPKILFASLGKVVPNPQQVIRNTREYLEEMRDKILSLHAGGKSTQQIMETLFGRESTLASVTQNQLSTRIFIESFLRSA